jgi:hypothetical protein
MAVMKTPAKGAATLLEQYYARMNRVFSRRSGRTAMNAAGGCTDYDVVGKRANPTGNFLDGIDY